ncbi:hypothetical protein E2N92_01040 [Methanofollis formosanus]|uniref:Uncharacterized protein n=1 Tax=Methanofollis formosanus TaxID=299308 RepID=A0A8G1A0E3_9EURY|nr:hypothetical protein [Methanofollis formosanus]QYZ78114.1 hypothetical protein E2N92_01040 [Methanofollis formosanus]
MTVGVIQHADDGTITNSWAHPISMMGIIICQIIFLVHFMQRKCDICGNDIGDTNSFCGMCGVDLREAKSPDEPEIMIEKSRPSRNGKKSTLQKDSPKDGDVIHWCAIRTLCDSHEMSFPLFMNLILVFASGKRKLGFCDCPACHQGYREMLANIINVTEKKKLTAHSRVIVIQTRGAQIDGVKFDIPEYVGPLTEKRGEKPTPQIEDPVPHPANRGKITIEIDSDVLENAVLTVLKSEKGREIIQAIPRKYTKTKGQDGKGKKG